MSLPPFVFGNHPETIIRCFADHSAPVVNHVLLGTYLEVLKEDGDFYRVATRSAGPSGWVAKADVAKPAPLKVFFVDVGQGDGTLVECPQGVVVIDGGQGDGFHRFLCHRYQPLIEAGDRIHIEAMIVSHPDADHYKGLQEIIEDSHFTIGTIYHNGLMRYPASVEKSRSRMISKGRLKKHKIGQQDAFCVVDAIDDLADVVSRTGDMPTWFRGFWEAAQQAHQGGRLSGARRLSAGDDLAGFESKAGGNLKITVLAPVLTSIGGKDVFLAFDEPVHRNGPSPAYPDHGYSHSHTRNGHSIVLRLEFGDHRLLLGGDLNIPAEQHLIEHYGENTTRFKVDVAKACHHGSADFSPEFVKLVNAHASVISSGDNKSFDHPTADAIGVMARYGRGELPLVFSTELARAVQVDSSNRVTDIHYGLINLRSNGTVLMMAQMKEQRSGKTDIWDSYTVPWAGKFWYERK